MTPIKYTAIKNVQLSILKLGFHGDHVDFDWRPYTKRSEAARADYDKLYDSIFNEGIKRPIITHGLCVLIGMRRVEIGIALGVESVDCLDITEDVSKWTRDDIPRLNAMKGLIEAYGY